ncbi:corrinoid protein [uncultured Alistipes sp.]|jgi:corrinoid protein of di/trimethylamine methyltransferase|uniref:corrinoid protein n=1 Tax=uncultured Alistipes sp. TaxID=538949 RepID=UPI001F8523E6|nr:corrinoid protein [uncultured Alistipes sp.]HIX96071.1 corrinoid protein [Candidatus Alistipes avistercoris]
MEEMNPLSQAIVAGNLEQTQQLVRQALAEGMDTQTLINDYLTTGMAEIGQRFQDRKAFVPNLLMSARAMKGALEILKPYMTEETETRLGTIVIGTVKGDLHDIGKNLVASMFEGCGFKVVNLGIDVSSEKFIQAIREHHADIVCLSALLTTTMNYMRNVVADLEKEGLRDRVKVMVGGAPVNEAFAAQIGADLYTSNANAAVTGAKQLLHIA